MKIFLAITLLFVSYSKAQELPQPKCEVVSQAKFKKTKIEVCGKVLDVELAENDMQRAVGLMCRQALAENAGMLFVFPDERHLSFWMKATYIPLSIGYFGKNKTLIDTYDMLPLNDSKTYNSKKPSQYALEVNKGWFEKNKITPGCNFKFLN